MLEQASLMLPQASLMLYKLITSQFDACHKSVQLQPFSS